MKGRHFYYALGETLARILPKRCSLFIASSFAWVYSGTFSKDLKNVVSNLREVLPKTTDEKTLKKEARSVIVNFAGYLVDFFYTYQLSNEFIRRHIEIRGLERIDRELSKKKGVILASAHVGNWEMGGMTLARLGYPVYGIALKHRDKKIDEIFQKRRNAHGLRIIPLGVSLRSCFKVLKANQILALNADRLFSAVGAPPSDGAATSDDRGGSLPAGQAGASGGGIKEKGLGINFLNKKVHFPRGMAKLSLATGAPVLPAFFVKTGYNRYLLEFQSSLEPSDEEGLIRQLAGKLEGVIRRYPTQWFIFQPFWEAPEWPA